MTSTYRNGLIWVLACIGISILWGTSIGRGGNGWVDFRAVYAGTRCLLHHHNPYNVSELAAEYLSEDGKHPPDTPRFFQAITLYVNVPSAFVILAPFAALPWGPAHVLWMLATTAIFAAAILLIWSAGARHAPNVATLLACLLAVNSEAIFGAGNAGGMAVGLCVVAVWCFLSERLAWAGVICMALSLALKPHDPGLVWLYFLLAGGVHRKRALQSLAITAVIGVVAAGWVWQVAPHWLHDWSANLAVISARGGINEPGPNSLTGRSASMVVDLQAAVSIFRDEPHFYNLVSYLVCGALLLVGLARTMRTRFFEHRAWMALAAVAALTMLVTYHRSWDAKLVMLAIPGCCRLWAEGGRMGKAALAVTTAAVLCTGDVTLAILNMAFNKLNVSLDAIGGKLLAVMLIRPASLTLLLVGVFYLWIYLRRTDGATESAVEK